MFIFFAELKLKEWLSNGDFGLNVGNFTIKIQEDRISCITPDTYRKSFDTEIRQPAEQAMKCVVIAQAVNTMITISIDFIAWVEIKLELADIFDSLTFGHFLSPTVLPVSNKEFLDKFSLGIRYANQAFTEMNMRIALEDFSRAIDSAWDECIYHCHHCLEAIRDYFGEKESGWEIMRRKLHLKERELRKVTNFSNKYIRHGSKREQIKDLTELDKLNKAKDSIRICQNVLLQFSAYLNENGVHQSNVFERGQPKYSFMDGLV